jgi:hypothetical protein
MGYFLFLLGMAMALANHSPLLPLLYPCEHIYICETWEGKFSRPMK